MPYIKEEDRQRIDDWVHRSVITMPKGLAMKIKTAGQLNYVITSMMNVLIERWGGPSYASFNELIGVLECAKLELYRRKIAPYENIKIAENGDV